MCCGNFHYKTFLVCWNQANNSFASSKQWLITGSAVALHCCKAHSEINRKMESSTPCKIVTPENLILKLGTCDYIDKVTYYTIFDVYRFSGASPQIGEI